MRKHTCYKVPMNRTRFPMTIWVTDWDLWPAADYADCFVEGKFRRDDRYTFRVFLEKERRSNTYPGTRLSEISILKQKVPAWHWFDAPLVKRIPEGRFVALLLKDLTSEIEVAVKLSGFYLRNPHLMAFDWLNRRFLRTRIGRNQPFTLDVFNRYVHPQLHSVLCSGLPQHEHKLSWREFLLGYARLASGICGFLASALASPLRLLRSDRPIFRMAHHRTLPGPVPAEFLAELARWHQDALKHPELNA